MARIQNLYQIYKLSSTFICENNLNIQNYTKKKAVADGQLISVGDCILFDRIRAYRGDKRSYKEIFAEVSNLRSMLRRCRSEGKEREYRVVMQVIMKTLFIKDVVNVEIKKKGEYRKLAKNGFYLNGVKYLRFSASASQIRHETVTFIAEDLYEPMTKILMCGLMEKTDKMNLAKLSAYFSLATSSILWVRTPRVCIIKDFYTTLKDQKIDWIDHDENDDAYIVERTMDIEMNSADGQGLISPECANWWAKDMELDYVPSSFVVRSTFIKGNLVPFDFKEYAKREGITRIYDRWGFGHNIEDIDVLISESQFKTYKYYSSWEEYKSYMDEGGIKWGVARYNRKYDDENVLATYQALQVLDINPDDVKELVKPTVDWLTKVCTGDPMYALLYSFGGFEGDDITFQDVYSRAQSLSMKAVVKNSDFLQDTYVQHKIYRNIVESINKAKIGKIWVRGNFSMMISDPIAQCRSALGLDTTGELPGEYIYSNFWNQRANEWDEIVLCRFPLLDKHEINHCTLYRSEEADYWYQYIKSGIIYSIYDLSTLRHSDSDYDGDLCLSLQNSIFLKGSLKNSTNPITYEKKPAPSQKITYANFIKTDIRGLGTKIGVYSNYSSSIQAMLGLFTKPEQERQREELLMRKKLLREINGQEIDRIKGVEAKGPPKEKWLQFKRVLPEDDDITKEEKYYHNSLVISKKPYFFRYLYPELNKKFKQFENAYNDISKCSFGIKFKKLLAKPNKTEAETKLVRRYHKFSPLINSNCTMNILCREFEDVDFNIQYDKGCKSMLPTFDDEFECKEEVLLKIRDLYRKYSNKKTITYLSNYFSEDGGINSEEAREYRFSLFDAIREQIEEEYLELNLSVKEGLFYIGQLSKMYAKFNWAFAWDLFGESILDCIENKTTLVPVEDENGREYLGRKYVLKEFKWEKEIKEERDVEESED